MGWYGEHIFPHLMEWVMGGEEFQKQRSLVLTRANGTVLEIGFGTGLNLPHYPAALSSLHAIDPAHMLPRKIAERSVAILFPLQIQRTLKALLEVYRVLKPDGVFLFLEHGRSEDAKVAAWQDRFNPVQNIIGCGCNLNRKIDQIIAQAGLMIMTLDRFRMQSVPRLGGEMYRGAATRPD